MYETKFDYFVGLHSQNNVRRQLGRGLKSYRPGAHRLGRR